MRKATLLRFASYGSRWSVEKVGNMAKHKNEHEERRETAPKEPLDFLLPDYLQHLLENAWHNVHVLLVYNTCALIALNCVVGARKIILLTIRNSGRTKGSDSAEPLAIPASVSLESARFFALLSHVVNRKVPLFQLLPALTIKPLVHRVAVLVDYVVGPRRPRVATTINIRPCHFRTPPKKFMKKVHDFCTSKSVAYFRAARNARGIGTKKRCPDRCGGKHSLLWSSCE